MTPETLQPQRSRRTSVAAADPPRRRGRPPRLSRAAILDQALKLVDAEGAEALTMRRLGAELGVEAMSLYRHVSNKSALLDGIAECMMAEVGDCRRDEGGWLETARSLSVGYCAVARAHPAAFELVGLRALTTTDALRPVEALLADLRAAGFPPHRAVAVYRLLASYGRGFALMEIAGLSLPAVAVDPSRLTRDDLPADEFPAIHELSGELSCGPTDAQFRAGLETILAGLRQELETLNH
ncbi:MAG: hypothetical protein QOF77_1338 [Solirubrobacteraceae bacterium]|nr:hypothetical protein [Solirubrobacteraceae bacterium]